MKLFNKKNDESSENQEMSFWDHIEELRKHIFFGVLWLALGCLVSGLYIQELMDFVLLYPAKQANLDLQNFRPFGQLFLYFKVVFIIGLIISSPLILFQFWRFIQPALYENEKKWVSRAVIYTSSFFLLGVAFSYFVVIPNMLGFAASFGSSEIKNLIDINEYFSYLTLMLLATGVSFEMPVMAWTLAKLGILKSEFMRKYRRHALILNLILAAVITPTPDPINQLIFAAPLVVLYELSVIIIKRMEKKRIVEQSE